MDREIIKDKRGLKIGSTVTDLRGNITVYSKLNMKKGTISPASAEISRHTICAA